MLLLWFLMLIVATAMCKEDILDITLLSKLTNNERINHICVAGRNVDGSAITFITLIGSTYPEMTSESKYVFNGVDYPPDDYNCDFENKKHFCTYKWTNNGLITAQSVDSSTFIQEPVLDKRWEKFTTYSHQSNPVSYKFSSNNINIGISVRTRTVASIILCQENTSQQCYWITINENKKPLMLRNCNNVNQITDQSKVEDFGCDNITMHNETVSLSEKKWNHFFLSQISDMIKICDKRKKYCYDFKIPNPITIKTMYLHLEPKYKGFWKIHNYSYLSINKEMADGNWKEIGPQIGPINGSLCVTLYAAKCENCELSFRFQGEDDTIQKVLKDPKTQWKYIKVTLSNAIKESYQLEVKATTHNRIKYWLIDDVRRCHLDETRIIQISTPMNSKDEVSCVAIKNQKMSSSIKGGEVGTAVNEVCKNNPTNIGINCDIPCSSVFGSKDEVKYCNNHIICKPTNNTAKTVCSCAAGYYGKQCKDSCRLGFYGYNCLKVCEPCKGFCLKSSGDCPSGNTCEANDMDAGCQKSGLLKILAPPIVINSTLTTITIQPKVNGEVKDSNILYEIQYKGDRITKWMKHGETREISKLETTTISNLTPLTEYQVRVVLYTDDKSFDTSEYEHIHTRIVTDCKDSSPGTQKYANMDIVKNDTTVKITWTPVCNGTLKFTPSIVKQNSWGCPKFQFISNPVNITNAEYLIPNLFPSTEYSLEIQSNDDESETMSPPETRSFTTAESELPILKSLPRIVSRTLTTITVQFNREEISRKELADQYEVQYKRKSSNNKWTRFNRNKVKQSNEIFLDNLNMKTTYDLRVVFYTKNENSYDSCIPTITTTTTCEDSSTQPLIKNLKVEPNKTEVIVNWTPVCENKFSIQINCVDDNWCKIPYKISPFNSLPASKTIVDLIPFTNYELVFMVDNLPKAERKTFQTQPDVAPTVSDLQVYSLDSDIISVRFKKPYPPHGELMGYYAYVVDCYGYVNKKYPLKPAVDCALWNDFQCLEICSTDSYKYDKFCYSISISAQNKDVNKGKSVETNERRKETVPPKNLRIQEKQEVCWEHPDFTIGKLVAFQINIIQSETFLFMSDFSRPPQSLVIQKLQKEYCFKFDQNLPLSTKYNISVQGVNTKNEIGQADIIEFITAPIQPQLVDKIKDSERGNQTQAIIIPAFDPATLTKNSSLYVVVCDSTSKHITPTKETQTSLKETLRSESGCQGTFWVAAKLNATKEEQAFTVGEGSEPLRPDVNYTITVLLVNEFHNEYSFQRYSLITSAPVIPSDGNPALYALLLLLLIIPIVGFFAYRKFMKPKFIPEPGTSFHEAPVQSNNVPMRNILNNLSRNMPNRKSEHLQTEHEQPLINKNPQNEEQPYTKLVTIGNLSEYVKQSLENGELERQHALFPKGGTKPWEYGMIKENKFKNRYNNLTAYDHTRVVLNKLQGDPFSDFINANYIDGYKTPKAYIATQGPKPSTLNDFWRMIWQENVKHIVMLANLIEGNKPKCEQYWPELGSTQEYHKVSVTFIQTDIYADFEFRSFQATCDGQTRMIQHLHFTSWPDHGVPQYPQSLVPFLRKILIIPPTAPIVVHCSAGVGRTGTIILADICLRMAAVEKQVDVLKYMHSIREQRAKLVDNFDQYKLVHMILLECLLAPETSLPCDNLAKAVEDLKQQDGIQKQIGYLKDTAWHSQVMKNPIQMEPENESKNRFQDIVPSVRRIYISRYPYDDEHSDYINAIPVDGFRIKDQFIVTQTPLPHTVKDFWRMVLESNVKVIVSLNEIIVNDKSCCLFWPPENEQYRPLPYLTLQCQSVSEGNYYDIYNIQLVNSSSSEDSVTNVSIIQYKNWKREQVVPDNIAEFIRLLEQSQNLSRQGDPLVVSCYDGSSACGLYVALSFIIEKIKLEQICDVCQAVRAIRINRSQFVPYRKQFEFLYQAAIHYVASFDDYSNFEGPPKS